jgi:hypothetical protein
MNTTILDFINRHRERDAVATEAALRLALALMIVSTVALLWRNLATAFALPLAVEMTVSVLLSASTLIGGTWALAGPIRAKKAGDAA